MTAEIRAYNDAKPVERRPICDRLFAELQASIHDAEVKIWHGAPVWFLDGNPIVGYHNLKAGIRLMFWSGQSFSEPGLTPTGTFQAAEKTYQSADEIDSDDVRRWVAESRVVQWDYKNVIRNRGLVRKA
jgi:hypothetical protein